MLRHKSKNDSQVSTTSTQVVVAKKVGIKTGMGTVGKTNRATETDIEKETDIETETEAGVETQMGTQTQAGTQAGIQTGIQTDTQIQISKVTSTSTDLGLSFGKGEIINTNSRPTWATHLARAYLSNHTKRMLLKRASYCCEYTDKQSGKRCESKYQLQLDHIRPVAFDGANDQSNLRVLCRTHNALMARRAGLGVPKLPLWQPRRAEKP